MKIGFCNGVFYKLKKSRFSPEVMEKFDSLNCNAIELFPQGEKHLDMMIDVLSKDVYSKYEWVSMHAPSYFCKNNEKTRRIFEKLRKVVLKFDIKNVTFHPDRIIDWDIMNEISDLPVSLENMDVDKRLGKSVFDMERLLKKGNFGLTLDVQHCYTNDQTMNTASEFISTFKDKIKEIHLSGFDPDKLHVPLHTVGQDIIINSVKDLDIPIILETTFESFDDIEKELEYVKKRL